MKYSIKPKNDSDKENAKQLELIMNHKLATYDDISEVIKELVDNFEFKRPCIIDEHEELISKTESEIWSAILSGCPSVTDSDVKRCFAIFKITPLCLTIKKRTPVLNPHKASHRTHLISQHKMLRDLAPCI